jgi:hypothetical protein
MLLNLINIRSAFIFFSLTLVTAELVTRPFECTVRTDEDYVGFYEKDTYGSYGFRFGNLIDASEELKRRTIFDYVTHKYAFDLFKTLSRAIAKSSKFSEHYTLFSLLNEIAALNPQSYEDYKDKLLNFYPECAKDIPEWNTILRYTAKYLDTLIEFVDENENIDIWSHINNSSSSSSFNAFDPVCLDFFKSTFDCTKKMNLISVLRLSEMDAQCSDEHIEYSQLIYKRRGYLIDYIWKFNEDTLKLFIENPSASNDLFLKDHLTRYLGRND